MNNVTIMGRITQDLELRQTTNGTSTVSFSVAVDRGYKGQNGEKQTDFIPCVAWKQQAEFIAKWFSKGRMIAITGALRTRSYEDKNGSRHYVMEVFVDKADFCGDRQTNGNAPQSGSDNRGGSYQGNGQQTTQNVIIDDLTDFEDVISDGDVPF